MQTHDKLAYLDSKELNKTLYQQTKANIQVVLEVPAAAA